MVAAAFIRGNTVYVQFKTHIYTQFNFCSIQIHLDIHDATFLATLWLLTPKGLFILDYIFDSFNSKGVLPNTPSQVQTGRCTYVYTYVNMHARNIPMQTCVILSLELDVIGGVIILVHSLMFSLSLPVCQVGLDWLPLPCTALI